MNSRVFDPERFNMTAGNAGSSEVIRIKAVSIGLEAESIGLYGPKTLPSIKIVPPADPSEEIPLSRVCEMLLSVTDSPGPTGIERNAGGFGKQGGEAGGGQGEGGSGTGHTLRFKHFRKIRIPRMRYRT